MSIVTWAIGRSAAPVLASRMRRGWIGIDVGTYSTKLAQIERRGSEYRISARWSLSHADPSALAGADTRVEALESQIGKLKPLRQLFSGRNCAACLPMSLVETRCFEIPKGTHSEQNRMAGEELAAELGVEPSELAYDCWDSSLADASAADIVKMSINAVPKKLAQTLGNRLLTAGLECQVLDGTSCALARAVAISNIKPAEDPVVAIDLSYTLPLVVLVKSGQPLFTRTLRGVGMQALMQPLEAALALSPDACQQLLVRYGLTVLGQQPTLATGKTMQIIAHPLQDLLSEIKRTVDYIHQHFRTCKPRHVCLFGGGAVIKNLPEHINHILQLPVTPWSMDGSLSNPHEAIYGLAAGLSALAWEENACS